MKILVTAGASGGHIFPAIATAQALQARGHSVTFVLGGPKFANLVEAASLPLVQLPAAAFNDRSPLAKVLAAGRLFKGMLKARALIAETKPAAIFSAGGYGSAALVLAGRLAGVPVVLNEQNVLPGKANKLMFRVAQKILLTFAETKAYLPRTQAAIVVTGTPLRTEILSEIKKPKPKLPEGHFHILVVGGSQGARVLSDVIPQALGHLTAAEQAKLHLTQQVRPEDMQRVSAAYANLNLASLTLQPFFADMPARYRAASLLIGRSGTGTLLEAAAFGLPAIYVPLELADGHQKLNAAVAETAGAALVLPQAYFTPANLLVHIRNLWQEEAKLASMAKAAKSIANLNATEAVCDEIEAMIGVRRHGKRI